MTARRGVPEGARCADLFWWRREGGIRTLVTIYAPLWAPQSEAGVWKLHLVLFDSGGQRRAAGETPLAPGEALLLDQERLSTILREDAGEGLLAVFPVGPREQGDGGIGRLQSLCDWFTDDGDVVSFHNDQSWAPGGERSYAGALGQGRVELTEMVVLPSAAESMELVVANGPEEQPNGALRLSIQNDRGRIRHTAYSRSMPPFSLTRLRLSELFPDLASFLEERAGTVSGRLAAREIFMRPWVITHEPKLSAYHGGNRYPWKPLHALESFHLPYRMGWIERLWPHGVRRLTRASMNPGAVIQARGLTTVVNVLNSHGDLDDDFWVDVRLHDASGRLVAERERWLLAKRNGVSRGDIRDLLPDPKMELVGHVALSFSRASKLRYPQNLQALFEYRSAHSTARSMLWGDAWNSVSRLHHQDVTFKAVYRAIVRPPLLSHVMVSNCGMATDYDRTAPVRLVLEDGEGRSLVHETKLSPHATLFASILELFPDALRFLGDRPAGIIGVESAFDLASMHFTRHEVSDAWSVEHNMALWCLTPDGEWTSASGS